MYLWAVPDGCLNILEWNFNWPCGCWPQSWPTPSLLEKFTRFSDVMISHTQSQAFFSQSLLFVFLSFFLFFVGGVFKPHFTQKEDLCFGLRQVFGVRCLVYFFLCECSVGVPDCKVSLFTQRHQRAKDNLCQRYRFVFSRCSLCSTMMYSLCGCEEEEMRSASLSQSSSLYAGVQS